MSTRIWRVRPLTCWCASSPWTPCFGGLDGLTLEAPRAGLAVPARGHPHIAPAEVVQHRPRTIVLPRPNIMLDALPGGEVMHQPAPGTATAEDREEAVEVFPQGMLRESPSGLGLGDIGSHQGSCLVGQVTRIGLASARWCGSHGSGPPARGIQVFGVSASIVADGLTPGKLFRHPLSMAGYAEPGATADA